MQVDFTDFIAFLKELQDHLKCSNEFFLELFHALYSKIHDDYLVILCDDLRSGKDIVKDESPIERVHKMQEKTAKAAAKSFFEQLDFFKLDPVAEELFISSVQYCLICRFKFIADPMDHQIRKGIRRTK
jgi:hypothetical protein